jgi:hypothetical protein
MFHVSNFLAFQFAHLSIFHLPSSPKIHVHPSLTTTPPRRLCHPHLKLPVVLLQFRFRSQVSDFSFSVFLLSAFAVAPAIFNLPSSP